jgi:hypothetical protein
MAGSATRHARPQFGPHLNDNPEIRQGQLEESGRGEAEDTDLATAMAT